MNELEERAEAAWQEYVAAEKAYRAAVEKKDPNAFQLKNEWHAKMGEMEEIDMRMEELYYEMEG